MYKNSLYFYYLLTLHLTDQVEAFGFSGNLLFRSLSSLRRQNKTFNNAGTFGGVWYLYIEMTGY